MKLAPVVEKEAPCWPSSFQRTLDPMERAWLGNKLRTDFANEDCRSGIKYLT